MDFNKENIWERQLKSALFKPFPNGPVVKELKVLQTIINNSLMINQNDPEVPTHSQKMEKNWPNMGIIGTDYEDKHTSAADGVVLW